MTAARSSADSADALLSELVGSTWSRESGVMPRAKHLDPSLRAGGVPRTLKLRSPLRATARQNGADAFAETCAALGFSSRDVAASMGLDSDREGAEAESGKLLVSFGELFDLAPVPVLLRVVAILLSRRLGRERLSAGLDADALALVTHHVDALRSLLRR